MGPEQSLDRNTQASDFVVTRNDLQQCKSIETRLPDADALPADTLLLKVDRFAFTANNIATLFWGDELKYWQLFPAAEGFWQHPRVGFGDVIASKYPGVAEDERPLGYFPMATPVVIEAGEVSKQGLRDIAAHRQGVAPVYNAYARIGGDPTFAGRQGAHQALLRPLFMLSFLVDDSLAENDFFGAPSVMLSSASSKTAVGLARLLHSARKSIRMVGLTSAANAGFVAALGRYEQVISLPSTSPIVFVVMVGNSELRARLAISARQ